MSQQAPPLPPGWQAQWDATAGRHVFIETATGRTQWQPPAPGPQAGAPAPAPGSGFRPSHPQGAARMSMPPMQGPPGMRGLSNTPLAPIGPGAPISPTGSTGPTSPPPSIGPGASRRRAYPTAHMAANSVSYSAGFDPGAQGIASGGAGYPGAGAGAAPQAYGAQAGPQLFTPGIPEAQSTFQSQQQQQASAYGQPAQAGINGAGQPGYGAGGFAPAPGPAQQGGVAGLTNSFQNMGMGAQAPAPAGFGAGRGNNLFTVSVSGVQPNVNDIEKPPPEIRLPPNSALTQDPRANADPSYQRCTLNAVPTTSALLQKTRLPFGLILTPYRSVREEDGDEPVPVVSDTVIARCRRCRTYINPYVQFIEGGNRWKCCMCNISNEVPQLFDWDQEKNQPADRWKRPELNSSVVEFIAPREYMVRPPQPPVYVFLIDVSYNSMNTGMAATAARTILETLDRIPNEDGRTRVCIIAVDTALHFFSIPEGGKEAEMLVVSDVDDVFLPKPNDLLLNLRESRAGIDTLLGRLSDMFAGSLVVGSALGAALQAAYKLISPMGGKIMCLTSTLPSLGPGALKNREDPKLLGTAKESTLLSAASAFYKTFPIDCSRAQVSVDMWLFASAYTDVATLACLPRYTGGQTYFYPGFNASRSEDALKFSHELAQVLASPICYEAVLRLRTTKGIRATQFHGNFFVRSTDLLALPAVPLDQNYAIECEIEESITAPFVVFQAVVLHSTSFGERRIRVINLALPTTTNMSEVYASADQQAIAMLLADKAVERSIHHKLEDARDAVMNKLVDIFTTYKSTMTSAGSGASAQLSIAANLSILPLLMLGLLKHVGIRASSQIPPDLRAHAQALITTLPTQLLLPYLHPNFYCLHNMAPEAGTWVTRAAPEVNGEEGAEAKPKETKHFVFPAKLNLTSEKLERHGLYLIEDGQTIFLWIGRDAVPQLCSDVFDAPNYAAVKGGKTTLPELDNSMNKRVRALVERIRTMRRGPYRPHLYVAKEDGEPSVRMWALSLLIEDRDMGANGMSYAQFLSKLRDRVNGGS